MRPIVLTVAGSDPTGGAGIQADVRTIEACGGWSVSVVTAITAQSTRAVKRVEPVAPDLVAVQLDALLDDVAPVAIKTGMLATAAIVRLMASRMRGVTYVCDPVLRSTGGTPLLESDAVSTLVEELLPRATVVTPNVAEATILSGIEVLDLDTAESAAKRILAKGPRAVLVKGGHLTNDRATDVLVTPYATLRFAAPIVEREEAHGTGCVFSAALVTYLACGLDLEHAVREAKRFVAEAMRHGDRLGLGARVTDPLHALHAEKVRR